MRFLGAMLAGTVVALLLFLLMQALVGGRDGFERDATRGEMVDFVRVRSEEIMQTRERQVPRKPPPPDKPPPPPQLQLQARQQAPRQVLDIETPEIAIALSGGPALGAAWSAADLGADGEVVPLVRIEPNYPREAVMRGLEGWVRVRFTILPDGSVANPSVVAAEPPRIFNQEAVRAILRWKFRPRIVDGQAVSREAEQTIDFRLERQP